MTDPTRPVTDPGATTAVPTVTYFLRLYISGATPRSARAIRNIKVIGSLYLDDKYDLEVIDVYQHLSRAHARNIVALPTLLKYFPLPVRRIIGDLSDTQQVLRGLGLWPIK
jgi:circadian clock protein KaiB